MRGSPRLTQDWGKNMQNRNGYGGTGEREEIREEQGPAQQLEQILASNLSPLRMRLRNRIRHVHVSLDEPAGELQPVSASERIADQRPGPEEKYRNAELSVRLANFHRQLSPTLRRTFQLRDINGLSIRETARILGTPAGTVKAQSARARQKLEQLMRRALRLRYRRERIAR
jgi:RNA polymerase sigma factor (sigma-70 family)